VPYLEDWLLIPQALAAAPFTPSWLWEQYFEHRAPLHKLVVCGSFRTFGLDERPVLLLDVGLFALLAAALIAAVRRVRGRPSYSDAFFPMVLLHFGHFETFTWAGTIVYVMTTFLVGMILILIFLNGSRFTPRAATLAGVCLVLLPLTYGGGVLYAACLSCGLSGLGWVQLRSADAGDRRAGRILIGFAAISLVIVALTFAGYQGTRFSKVPGDFRSTPVAVLKTTVKFLTASFGFAVREPYFGGLKWVMVTWLFIAGGCLVAGILRQGLQGSRPLLGLGLVFGSTLVVALAVGYSRAPWGPDWLEASRYAAPAAPTLLCLYFIWEACGPRPARPFGRAALCALVFAFLTPEWAQGRGEGWLIRNGQEAFLSDVRAGVPIPQLIGRHARFTYYRQDLLEGYLRLLRDRGYGEYAHLPADPTFREVPLTAPPTAVLGASWDGERGRSTSNAPELIFDLPHPTPVAGIRMRYSNHNSGGWSPNLWVDFRVVGEDEYRQWRSFEELFVKPDRPETEVGFWVDATVDRVRIRPDIRPCDFTLNNVVLLVPDPPREPAGGGLPGDPEGARREGGDGQGPASRPTSGAATEVESAARVHPAGTARSAPEPRS
jgi:hypothetical protein